jgi:hypothetical protein
VHQHAYLLKLYLHGVHEGRIVQEWLSGRVVHGNVSWKREVFKLYRCRYSEIYISVRSTFECVLLSAVCLLSNLLYCNLHQQRKWFVMLTHTHELQQVIAHNYYAVK